MNYFGYDQQLEAGKGAYVYGLFFYAPKVAMKLKDAYSLEGKL